MPKILITEKDETRPGIISENTDIVFIPGFVDAGQEPMDGCSFLKANEPHLFTSVYEFESLCGPKPATFDDNQSYPTKFDTNAHDSTSVMFKAGDPDPAYIMAKELLASGLPVVYQRVNEADSNTSTIKYELISEIPTTAVDDKSPYYYKKGDSYLAYKDKVNYPNFKSFTDSNGASTVHAIKDLNLKLSFTEVSTYFNAGINDGQKPYYLIDGTEDSHTLEINGEYLAIAEGSAIDESNAEPTLRESLLRQNVAADGKVSYQRLSDVLPDFETYQMTDADKDYVYALAVRVNDEPADWETNYTKYFNLVEPPKTKSTTVKPEFILIAEVESAYKQYEAGNTYEQKTEETTVFTVENMYDALDGMYVFDTGNLVGIADKGNYSVKYLTSGGYPVFEYDSNSIMNKMISIAEHRGDCVAIIDHTDYVDRSINPNVATSVFAVLNNLTITNGDFATMFTPWATYSRITSDIKDSNTFRAPASFAYLTSLADSIKTNANWLAVAGSARGGVRNLSKMDVSIPNGIADMMQKRDNSISINPITNIKPYGYTIWGNRTLKKSEEDLVATNFLNIRNLVSDVKKTCYRTARKLTFEQDNDILWLNFKSEISKLLDRMKAGYGISGYKILKDTNHAKANAKATVCAKIVLYPTYAVEDFYITVVLQDDEVTVE